MSFLAASPTENNPPRSCVPVHFRAEIAIHRRSIHVPALRGVHLADKLDMLIQKKTAARDFVRQYKLVKGKPYAGRRLVWLGGACGSPRVGATDPGET